MLGEKCLCHFQRVHTVRIYQPLTLRYVDKYRFFSLIKRKTGIIVKRIVAGVKLKLQPAQPEQFRFQMVLYPGVVFQSFVAVVLAPDANVAHCVVKNIVAYL